MVVKSAMGAMYVSPAAVRARRKKVVQFSASELQHQVVEGDIGTWGPP